MDQTQNQLVDNQSPVSEQLNTTPQPPVKKNRYLTYLIIILVVVLAGLGLYWKMAGNISVSQESMSDWSIYKNEQYSFEFKYPNSLTLKETSDSDWPLRVELWQEGKEVFYLAGNGPGHGTCIPGDGVPSSSKINIDTQQVDDIFCNDKNKTEWFLFERKNVKYEINFSNDSQNIFHKIISTIKFTDSSASVDASRWKTYEIKEYGLKFEYPSDFTIQNNPDNINHNLDLVVLHENSYQGSIIDFPSTDFGNPPPGTDLLNWLKKYKLIYNMQIINDGYKINGLSTVHLFLTGGNGGTHDEFYFIKDNKLFSVILDAEDTPTLSANAGKPLDLNNDSKWYNHFLKSITGIK